MIPRSAEWKNALAQAVRDPDELLRLLDLPKDLLPAARKAASLFPLRVPRGYISRMAKGDPDDPLLRQVLPLNAELSSMPGFEDDPVGDLRASVVPGLLHKYQGRVLLVATGACAVHCRYCFRRHFPYGQENPARGEWSAALEYISADPSIKEVILSGGDPLLLDDGRLAQLVGQLSELPHLERLRIHTRLPVVLPERVNAALAGLLANMRLKPVVVIHANHAKEVCAQVTRSLEQLRDAGVALLNQTVLLRGINDDAESLADLSSTLFAAGVLPYYLHLLDRVKGAAHFEVDEQRARQLVSVLRHGLPGYMVPRLVREVAGEPFKRPIL